MLHCATREYNRYVINYRTPAVAHPHVAFDVQRWGAGEPERLHVCENLRFVDAAIGPRASEA